MASIPRFNIHNRALNNDGDAAVNDVPSPQDTPKIKDGLAALGFGHIPEQMHRKAVKKGFNFTIMVVGETGLGKSTFVNTLLMTDLYKDRELFSVADSVEATTKVVKRFIELDEKGVKLRLTIIDTPGFGDAVNCEKCWIPIVEYINGAFEHYFKEECGLNRKNIQDNRVHCCLYFISPYGRGLKSLDIEVIKNLQHKVNVVPVIAKADSLSAVELTKLKRSIMQDIERHQLEIYRLPECDSDEEDTLKKIDKEIKASLPFCVIGSPDIIESQTGTKIHGRKYLWGNAEVENAKHCDFNRLRVFLLKTHMQDLKDMTSDVLYENYRAQCITERMNRRQTERQATTSDGLGTPKMTAKSVDSSLLQSTNCKHIRDGKQEMSEPGFEAIVDPENLLIHKEREIERMRALCEKLQSQLQASPQPS